MRVLLALGLIAVFIGTAAAEETAKSPAVQVEELKAEFATARQDFNDAFDAAGDDEVERQRVLAEMWPTPGEYSPRFFDIADDHEGTDAAKDALIWIVEYDPRSRNSRSAITDLAESFADDPAMATVCWAMHRDGYRSRADFIREMLESSEHEEVRGMACYALAWTLMGSEPDEAVALLQRARDEFADVAGPMGERLGDAAKNDLFERNSLVIGKPAPEIVGTDIDGVEFKLSDYRGKVVFLDFWGHW